MDKLGDRIKRVRLARRMTRKELGTLMDLKHPDERIDAYESGKRYPKADMIMKFANALEVSDDWLVTGVIDDITRHSLQKKDIFNEVFVDYYEAPKIFPQFSNFLEINKITITECLDEKDYKEITNFILDKIISVKGNIDMLVAPITIEEYQEMLEEQQTMINDLVANGEGYINDDGVYIQFE